MEQLPINVCFETLPFPSSPICSNFQFSDDSWVPLGSVVMCLTRNPGVLGSSLTRSSGFFCGSVLGQDTSEPSLVLVKPRQA